LRAPPRGISPHAGRACGGVEIEAFASQATSCSRGSTARRATRRSSGCGGQVHRSRHGRGRPVQDIL